jgi:hypothetical protein
MPDRIGGIESGQKLLAIGKISHDRKEREEGTAEGNLARLNICAGKLDERLHGKENDDGGHFQRNAPHRISENRFHDPGSYADFQKAGKRVRLNA